MNKIKIFVMSRSEAQDFDPGMKFSIISVWTPDDEPNTFVTMPNKILSLSFSDINDKRLDGIETSFGVFQIFTELQARKIIKFVESELERGVEAFVIHCDAGVSRSPAIGQFLDEVYNGAKKVPHSRMLYNTYVYKTLNNFYHSEEYRRERNGK